MTVEELEAAFEEAPLFFVDIPQMRGNNGSDEWRNIATFHSREEAIQFAKDNFGADDNGMVCLISES